LKPSNLKQTELYQTVAVALVKMKDRCLDFTPAVENLPNVAEVMTEDLFSLGYRDSDCERIRYAIDTAGRTYARFPTIHHIKNHIKSRSQIAFEKEGVKKISHKPVISEEKRIENQKKIREMIAGISTADLNNKPKPVKEKVIPSDPKKQARLKQELEQIKKEVERKSIKTPEEIEAEENEGGI